MRMRHPRSLLGRGVYAGATPWSVPTGIRSLQVANVTITDPALTNTSAIVSVDLNNSILVYSGQDITTGITRLDQSRALLAFTNATTVTSTRIASATGGEVLVTAAWVIEFYPGILKSVQRGTISLAGANSNTATITKVNTDKAFVMFLGYNCAYVNVAPTADIYLARVTLTNSTTVTARHQQNTADAFTVGYQVVEFA